MKVDFALLCDAVTVREGLLHILGGGITRVVLSSFPGQLPVGLALRIVADEADGPGVHSIVLALTRDDTELGFMKYDFQYEVDDPAGLDGLVQPMAVQLHSVEVEVPGRYVLDVKLDGDLQCRVHFVAQLRDSTVADETEGTLSDASS